MNPFGASMETRNKETLLDSNGHEPVIFTRSKAILSILKISCSHYHPLPRPFMSFFVSFHIVLPIPLVLFFSTNSRSNDLDLDYVGSLDVIIIIYCLRHCLSRLL
jgi:hypothetical protein